RAWQLHPRCASTRRRAQWDWLPFSVVWPAHWPRRPPSRLIGDSAMHSEIERIAALSSVDSEYQFGKPTVYLSAHELARVTLLRSKLGETRADREAEAQPCVRGNCL